MLRKHTVEPENHLTYLINLPKLKKGGVVIYVLMSVVQVLRERAIVDYALTG